MWSVMMVIMVMLLMVMWWSADVVLLMRVWLKLMTLMVVLLVVIVMVMVMVMVMFTTRRSQANFYHASVTSHTFITRPGLHQAIPPAGRVRQAGRLRL